MRAAIIALVPVLVALAAPAHADIVVVPGNPNNAGTENVTFADQAAASTVFGSTLGQTNNFSVTGTTVSAGNQLLATSGDVLGSGSNVTSLTLFQTGLATFTNIVFNLDAAVDGTVDLSVLEGDSTANAFSFAVAGNGQNFFTITAINGQTIRSVTATGVFGTTLTGVGNVRFGPVAAAAVPEPATWGMMLLGFAGIGLAMRRRRRLALA